MPMPLSVKLPPRLRQRMLERNIKTVKELAVRIDSSVSGLHGYLSNPKPTLITLMKLLKELGYSCDSPEFEIINEIIDAKDLRTLPSDSNISESKRIQQYLFIQSTVQIRAA